MVLFDEQKFLQFIESNSLFFPFTVNGLCVLPNKLLLTPKWPKNESIFSSQSLSFNFYIWVYDPPWTHFYIPWKVWIQVYFPHEIVTQLFQHHLWKGMKILSSRHRIKLATLSKKFHWSFMCAFTSMPLTFLPILKTISHCLDYWNVILVFLNSVV